MLAAPLLLPSAPALRSSNVPYFLRSNGRAADTGVLDAQRSGNGGNQPETHTGDWGAPAPLAVRKTNKKHISRLSVKPWQGVAHVRVCQQFSTRPSSRTRKAADTVKDARAPSRLFALPQVLEQTHETQRNHTRARAVRCTGNPSPTSAHVRFPSWTGPLGRIRVSRLPAVR